MTREDRLKTHIKIGRLGIEPSTNLNPEKNGEHFDMVMWDERGESCFVVATIDYDDNGNPYMKSYGDRVIDNAIDPGAFYGVMKLLFELEKM